jgi:ABC-type transport system involved in Fe-S cluster assembly fused permease/ATPase subunit
MADTYKNITKEWSDIESLWTVVDEGPTIVGYDTGTEFHPSKKSIVIKDIVFGYDESLPIFQNFSLEIPF